MPRQPRLNLPGLFYHVMVRGIERRKIFRAPSDYTNFLYRLRDGLAKTGCRCFAWALMPNHIHLLLISGIRGLVSLMHPLLTGYATAFNLRYRRAGHLFQNRYKAIICEEDPYFLELVRYIPLNPVRAGRVHSLQELASYPWTSYSAAAGTISRPWTESAAVLSHFGSNPEEALLAYNRYLLDGWNQGYQDRLEGGGLLRSLESLGNSFRRGAFENREAFDARILGSGEFVDDILRQAEREERKTRHVQKTCSLEELRQAIAKFSNVDPQGILSKDRRRPVARARAMLAFAATEWLGETGTKIASWMGLSTSAIAQARARGRTLADRMQLFDALKLRN